MSWPPAKKYAPWAGGAYEPMSARSYAPARPPANPRRARHAEALAVWMECRGETALTPAVRDRLCRDLRLLPHDLDRAMDDVHAARRVTVRWLGDVLCVALVRGGGA